MTIDECMQVVADNYSYFEDVAKYHTRNSPYFQDYLQDAVMRFYAHLERNPERLETMDESSVKPAMYFVIYSTFVDDKRKRKLCTVPISPNDDVEQDDSDIEQAEALHELVIAIQEKVKEIGSNSGEQNYYAMLYKLLFAGVIEDDKESSERVVVTPSTIRGLAEKTGISPSTIFNDRRKIKMFIKDCFKNEYINYKNKIE